MMHTHEIPTHCTTCGKAFDTSICPEGEHCQACCDSHKCLQIEHEASQIERGCRDDWFGDELLQGYPISSHNI